MKTRAFTMLEVTFAAALGCLVVLACVSVFYAMDRSDTLLERRATQANDLHNLRLVALRATTTLVMSSEQQPARDDPDNPDARLPRRNQRDPNAPLPVPRLLLENDPNARGLGMFSTGGGDFSAEASPIQRLELVLSDPPVPAETNDFFVRAGLREGQTYTRRGADSPRASSSSRADKTGGAGSGGSGSSGGSGMGDGSGDTFGSKSARAAARTDRFSDRAADRASGDTKGAGAGAGGASAAKTGRFSAANDPSVTAADGANADDEVAPVRAVRGALELRPQEFTGKETRRAMADGKELPQAWEMWWVPLPPRPNGSEPPSAGEIALFGKPYLVASNLRFVKWRLFDDRSWHSTAVATWEQQLPAYIELSAETTAGLSAKWLFEVDWARGPEVPPSAKTDDGVKKATPVDQPSGGTPRATPVTPPRGGGGATSKTSGGSRVPTRPSAPVPSNKGGG